MPVTYHCIDCSNSSERQDYAKLPSGWSMTVREKKVIKETGKRKKKTTTTIDVIAHQCPECAQARAQKILRDLADRVDEAMSEDRKRNGRQ